MKYQKPVNIWALNDSERAALQPGQWVYAGVPADKGVWLGAKPSGSQVVAWYMNAKGRASYNSYIRSLRNYALGV